MTTDAVHPEVLWAQRTDMLFIRINVADLVHDELNITDEGLTFKGESSETKRKYDLQMTFFKPINSELVKREKTGRALRLVVQKKTDEAYWPRLLKESGRAPYLKVDFELWKDEDEEEEEEEQNMMPPGMGMGGAGAAGGAGGFDFSQLAGMNGMDFSKFDPKAMGGMGGGDSDDDDEAADGEEEESAEVAGSA